MQKDYIPNGGNIEISKISIIEFEFESNVNESKLEFILKLLNLNNFVPFCIARTIYFYLNN